jgi:multidrug efflux pump subunit AcrA (membrane-fusion protein)
MHECPMLKMGEKCPMLALPTGASGAHCPYCSKHLKATDPKPEPSAMSGEVMLDAAQRNRIGAKIETVAERPLRKTLLLQAKVAYDPELYGAQLEYLQKIKRYQKTSTIIDPYSSAAAERARTDLVSMGLSPELIREMSSWKTPDARLIGADPSGELWVNLFIYGEDLGDISAGADVEIQNPIAGKEPFRTKIKYLDHHVHSSTGNVRAWALVKNAEGHLRPEMYLQAKMIVELPSLLSVSEGAVLYSGDRPYVFVQSGEGVFEPRVVELGRKAEGYYEVRSGLKSQDVVIASGNFLVDSESRIRSAIDGAAGTEHGHD